MSKALIAAPLGALIGLLMGAVGGGGSLISIPILVYLVDQSAREAQATTLVIVMVASLAGVISYLRQSEVRWRAGLAFGAATGATAYAGSLLNRQLDSDVLLLAFAPVMLLGAAAILSDRTDSPESFTPWRQGVGWSQAAKVVGLGLAVGWIIGLFGVGGGFVIVPVLVVALHLSMVEAVGTSLLIVILGSSTALADRIVSGDVAWEVAIPFSIAALIGSLLGRRVADRIPDQQLKRGFAAIVTAAALYTGVSSALAIW